MDVTPPAAVAAFAAFVRQRLADVGGTLAPLWSRREGTESEPTGQDASAFGAARQLAMVVAAAPLFAPTSHARARLLRQAHAAGLLTARETRQASRALGAPKA